MTTLLALTSGLLYAPGRTGALPFVPPFDTSVYDGSYEVLSDDKETGAVAYWRTDDDNIYIGLASNAWWVGFGMNHHGPSMPGADIVICREHEDGVVTGADYHSDRLGPPEMDDLQDWATIRAGRQLPHFPNGPQGACDAGWTYGGNVCYWGSTTNSTWEQAEDACAEKGGAVAKIASEAQNLLVRSLIATGETVMWVGAHKSGGSWKWHDGSTVSYAHWAPDQPKGEGACVAMGWSGFHDAHWFAVDCRWKKPRFVCTKPVKTGVPTVPPERQKNEPLITWCELSRSRYTCETDQDYQLADLMLSIHGLLAWSPHWQSGEQDLRYHGDDRRHSFPLTFVGSVPEAPAGDILSFTLEAPTHQVSQAGGSYACSYHVLPVSALTRYHIVWAKVEQGGPAREAGLQHHVDLNACSREVPWVADGAAADCSLLMAFCYTTLLNKPAMYTRAGYYAPSNAGYPIGKGALQYVVISRHFYNPANKIGFYDVGTKFHLKYTSALRENDLSQISLGALQFRVPPQTFGVPVSGWCTSECTRRVGRVQVTNVAFHMHGYAKSTRIRVIRNGTELEPLASLRPWSQPLANLVVSRTLEPGDILILECVYDNDLDEHLHYGDEINDEMCYGFLTVLGQNTMTSCLDYPWGGFHCTTPDDEECKGRSPKSYCPDAQHTGARAIVENAGEREQRFTPYVEPSRAECEASSSFEVVPAIPGKCRPEAPTIVGSKSCNAGMSEMRIEWTTDCSTQTIQFDVSARTGPGGWLAIGLHDAGTAAEPRSLGGAMRGADIVQVSPSTGKIREGLGVGYTAPRAKEKQVATLSKAEVVSGRSVVRFTRPFLTPEGVTLSEDRFIWLVCAFKSGTTDFDVKHQAAEAVSGSRLSLFGGLGESKRRVAKKAASPAASPATNGDVEEDLFVGHANGCSLAAIWAWASVAAFHMAVTAAVPSLVV